MSQQHAKGFREEEDFGEPLPDFRIIKLIAKGGVTFHMDIETAKVSGYLSRLFAPGSKFKEAITGEVNLKWIRPEVMERVCDYMHWKRTIAVYNDRKHTFSVDPQILVETTIASDFLQL